MTSMWAGMRTGDKAGLLASAAVMVAAAIMLVGTFRRPKAAAPESRDQGVTPPVRAGTCEDLRGLALQLAVRTYEIAPVADASPVRAAAAICQIADGYAAWMTPQDTSPDVIKES